MDTVHQARVRRADVSARRRRALALDERREGGRSVGAAGETREPDEGGAPLTARIGSYYWQQVNKRLTLTAQFVREYLPPPRLRMFKWLMAPQK